MVKSKDINTFLAVSDDSYNQIVNALRNIRNSVGHGSSEGFLVDIFKLFNKPKFGEVLDKLLVNKSLYKRILKISKLFENRDKVIFNCKADCVLAFQSARGSQLKLGEHIAKLYRKYPKSFVDENIIRLVCNEYLD